MDLLKTIFVLIKLSNLKSLHIENDRLHSLPKQINEFKKLENLFLNDNFWNAIPRLEALNHLQNLDLKGNKINIESEPNKNFKFGFQINL